jgi:hypothetical protein
MIAAPRISGDDGKNDRGEKFKQARHRPGTTRGAEI